MYGWDDLKKTLNITNDEVQCPVIDCTNRVRRQRKKFRRDDTFLCMKHNIFISPSTFEYEKLIDNMLSKEDRDLYLLSDILKVKTESRMRRDNSEDAVVWNIFRTLEKNGKISSLVSFLQYELVKDIHVIYWSHFRDGRVWEYLTTARNWFGETKFGTEPDLILYSPRGNWLLFLEAKLGSKVLQKFRYAGADYSRRKEKYGNNALFKQVFKEPYTFESIAVEGRHYELLRQWLLGNWLARKLDAKFHQILLVKNSQRMDGESFSNFIVQDNLRTFKVLTWNELYDLFSSELDEPELTVYLKQKTLGYKRKGARYHLQGLLTS